MGGGGVMGIRLGSRSERQRRARAREIARADATLAGRYWLTAKAARLLGHRVGDDVDDGDAVVFTHKERT